MMDPMIMPGTTQCEPLESKLEGCSREKTAELHTCVDQLFSELDVLASRHQTERRQCLEVWLRRQSSAFTWFDTEEYSPQSTPFPDAIYTQNPQLTIAVSGSGLSQGMPHDGVLRCSRQCSPSSDCKAAAGRSNSLLAIEQQGTSPLSRAETSRSEMDRSLIRQSMEAGKKKKKKKQKSGFVLANSCESAQKTRLQAFTASRVYEIGSALLIAFNAISIGWQVQWSSNHALKNNVSEETESQFFVVLSASFTVAFAVELALRWVADGFVEFFRTEEIGWCVFDVVIVGIGLIELMFSIVFADNMPLASEITLLRVLRVMRVVRVLRVIRVMRFFRELRMMIWSIMGSLKSLMWVMVVLMLLFYVFAILVTQGVSAFLIENNYWKEPGHQFLVSAFGTLDQSIVSLFMAMSGGQDWSLYYKALVPLPIQYRFLFLGFIAFSIFAVVNIVTGVFVQSALESSNQDREVVVHEELQNKKKYCEAMRQFFEEIDMDGSGTIGYKEFTGKLDDERVIAYFNALKLDVSDADMLFKLIDFDQSGEIGIDEFLVGCYKLQGESRTLDMKVMQFEVRWLHEVLVTFMAELKSGTRPSGGANPTYLE